MIRYALTCDRDHGFESWFRDSASYDFQRRRGLLSCPQCGSQKVDKAIMSPSIARRDRDASPSEGDLAVERLQAPEGIVAPPAAAALASVALLNDEALAVRAQIRALRAKVKESAADVGLAFAQEALKIHHGEADSRPIYGQASPDEARMLAEEGVPFLPLPMLPEDRN
jgi:hypothetical protein